MGWVRLVADDERAVMGQHNSCKTLIGMHKKLGQTYVPQLKILVDMIALTLHKNNEK